MPRTEPTFRYAGVLVGTLVEVLFLIVAPTADWSRAVGLAIAAAILLFVIATSRDRAEIRRDRIIAIVVITGIAVALAATGAMPLWLLALCAGVVTAAVPAALVHGLLRAIRDRGVTPTAVAGALAIYLSVGVLFAWVVGVVAAVGAGSFFAEHTDGTQGDKVYYSFTVLTTTGFGDLTPATPVGHAVAVLEMLTGQIYLVTVIGLLIGNFAARRR